MARITLELDLDNAAFRDGDRIDWWEVTEVAARAVRRLEVFEIDAEVAARDSNGNRCGRIVLEMDP